ncbi:MAG: cytochrome P450 [Actinomycetota bacterium]
MAVGHRDAAPAGWPTPRGLPLLGSTLDLTRDLLGTFHRSMLEHGDAVRFVVGPPGMRTNVYAFFHPDGVQHVLASGSGRYAKGGRVYRELTPLLGNGLLTSEGEVWRRQKRLVQPLFTRRRVGAYVGMMAEEGEQLVERWRRLHAGGAGAVDLDAQMTALTLRVVGRALFGSDMGPVVDVLRPVVPYLSRRALRRGLVPKAVPAHWRTPGNVRADAARARVTEVVDELVASRRAAGADAEGEPDLLSLLLQAQDPEGGVGLDDEEVRAQVLIFLLAGHETTATSLTFTLHLIGNHPEVQERVRAEADEVLGAGRTIGADDVLALRYTTMVVKEAMRLFPAAHSMGRISTGADRVCGWEVPPDVAVVVSPWATHRHPSFWEDPERFDPERFAPERERERHRYAYVPFGGGPRACIGQYFSMLEAVLVTAQLVRAFRLVTDPGPVALFTGITLRPAEPLPCRIAPR